MGAKKARRKLARKVIARHLAYAVSHPIDLCRYEATHAMSDREFDRLVQEIRNARVTVTWPDEKGRK